VEHADPAVRAGGRAIAAGAFFVEMFVGEEQGEFWRGAIFNAPANHILEEAHHAPAVGAVDPGRGALLGLFGAAYVYLLREGLGARIAPTAGRCTFFYNKWFFDEIYDVVFVKSARWLGDVFWKRGDAGTIDKLGP
jgi:NADH-quinone oxidoreductase subunit L